MRLAAMVPAGASGAVVNLTAVEPAGPGFLAVYPCAQQGGPSCRTSTRRPTSPWPTGRSSRGMRRATSASSYRRRCMSSSMSRRGSQRHSESTPHRCVGPSGTRAVRSTAERANRDAAGCCADHNRTTRPSRPDHSPLRIAVLAPIAWRTPPRHYGPWEQFASLLTEGLVAAGHDVTLFATADSVTTAKLHGTSRCGWSEDAVDRPEGRRVPPHRVGVRARRRVRHHSQQLRLPPADLQRPRRHAGRDHDPRILVAPDRPGLRALRRRPPPTWRSATPTVTRAALRRHRSTMASTPARSPSIPTPGEHLLFFGRIHPDKGTAHAIEVADRTGRRLDIAGIIQDEEYFRDAGRAPHRRRARPLSRPDRCVDRVGDARRGARPAAPHRLRRAIRVQRRRGDGMRHTRDRLRARLDARDHRRRRTGFLVSDIAGAVDATTAVTGSTAPTSAAPLSNGSTSPHDRRLRRRLPDDLGCSGHHPDRSAETPVAVAPENDDRAAVNDGLRAALTVRALRIASHLPVPTTRCVQSVAWTRTSRDQILALGRRATVRSRARTGDLVSRGDGAPTSTASTRATPRSTRSSACATAMSCSPKRTVRRRDRRRHRRAAGCTACPRRSRTSPTTAGLRTTLRLAAARATSCPTPTR